MEENFSPAQTGFWGAVAAFFLMVRWYFQYKTSQSLKIENQLVRGLMEQQQKLGNEKIKAVLDGMNEVALEIIKVSKDGIQVKDAAQIVEDILLNSEFKSKLALMVSSFQGAMDEIKDIDIAEGIDLAKFEYDGVKKIIEALK
jgi:hypothetical protein